MAMEYLKRVTDEGSFRNLLVGKVSPDDAGKFNLNAVGRYSGGLSAYLFGRNAANLAASGNWLDWLYVPIHAAASLSQGATALLPSTWKEAIFGTDATGIANTPFQERYSAAAARIDRVNVGDGLKSALKNVAAAVLKDATDAAYLVGDTINAIVWGFSRGDWIAAAGIWVSVAGDAFFAAGPGIQAVGRVGPAAAAGQTATSSMALTRFLFARSPAWFTGIGAVLSVVGSVVNGRGVWKAAHKFDQADADYLQTVIGVRNREVAETLASHNDFLDEGVPGVLSLIFPNDQALGGVHLKRSAGNCLMEAFRALNHTRADVRDTINRWTPDQAEMIADFIREKAEALSNYEHPINLDDLLTFATEQNIPLLDPRVA